ncbi:DnaJ family protein [Pseudohyphozyma bogoriensis]|nr:DnaJ family protein [Pseudohyphozyma bogoriensis]
MPPFASTSAHHAGDDDDDEEPLWSAPASNDVEDSVDNLAYYARLNVEKDATDEEIARSYKKLAALLHPDRHPNPELKEAADRQFQELSRAFEILSDPRKRQIYDNLGEEGLRTNWDVGLKYKTAAELKAEFERLNREQLEKNVENLVKSKGELTMNVDARALFVSDEDIHAAGGPPTVGYPDRIRSILVTQQFLKHSFTMGTTLLRPRSLNLKGTYSPDPDTFATLTVPIKDFDAPPQINLVLGRRVFDQITGTFTIRSGNWAIGPWGSDSLPQISNSTVITENMGAGMTLEVGVNGSMVVKLRVARLGQKLTLPVLLSSSFDPTVAIGVTVVPTLGMIAANHFILNPRKRRKVSSRISDARKENAEFIAEKRKEADDAVLLLSESVKRKVDAEGANGLVIVEAVYGVLESIPTKTELADQRWMDVTVALQSLVTNSQIIIPGGRSKSNLLGFFDVAMGEKKALKVTYTFRGTRHEAVVGDFDGFAAPLRAHLV